MDLLRRHRTQYRVEAVCSHRSAAALAGIAREFGAGFAAVADESEYPRLKDELGGTGIEVAAGREAIVEAACRPADWVMAAVTGSAGLEPTLAAVERGATVALANKECLVCAGTLFMRRAEQAGAEVLPVDSEHNAVFQALSGGQREDVARIILTASGGPFRTWPKDAIQAATVEQALRHPNWSMGPKVTIDSATLMNKGLELIEAHHLFGLEPARIDVVVHAQSVVHGLVEYRDGSVIAQLGPPDMRVPIAHCLAWPSRLDGASQRLDLIKIGTLTFEAPDLDRFPSLGLARRALEAGDGAPTVLNAANEIAVSEFIAGRLAFPGIAALVDATIEVCDAEGTMHEPTSIKDALAIDQQARSTARTLLPKIAAMTS